MPDLEGNTHKFEPGDLVWYFTQRKIQGKPEKITDAWLGLYTVVDRISEVLISLKPANTEGRTIVVPCTRVRRYQGAKEEDKYQPPAEPPGDDQGDKLAEEVGHP